MNEGTFSCEPDAWTRQGLPSPDELFGAGSQNHRLYSRLLRGPLENREIFRKMYIPRYAARIFQIREKLQPYLADVLATPDEARRTRWTYRIVGGL